MTVSWTIQPPAPDALNKYDPWSRFWNVCEGPKTPISLTTRLPEKSNNSASHEIWEIDKLGVTDNSPSPPKHVGLILENCISLSAST